MNKKLKKMSLNSETLLGLTPDTLVRVGGGVTTPVSVCSPTACRTQCGSCQPPCPISSPPATC